MTFTVKHLLFRCIHTALRKVHVDAFWRRSGYSYVPDYYGRAAHKQIDIRRLPGFGCLADTVIQQGKSSLYYDRLHVIYQAIANSHFVTEKNPGTINLVEVGVYKGGTSYFMASTAAALGLKEARLHCFDTFEGHPAEDVRPEIDRTHKPGNFADTQFASVNDYLKGFANIRLYKGRFQDSCTQIEAEKIHLVHLDVDIYEPTSFALNFFDSRLIAGGIIIVDDYSFVSCGGVKLAVDEFLRVKSNYFSLHVLTGQCVLVKLREEIKYI